MRHAVDPGWAVPEGALVRPAPRPALTGASPTALENHLGGANAFRYRAFQRRLIEPFCGRSLLEVGAGLGEFSAQLLHLNRLLVTEADEYCLARLHDRFRMRRNVEVRGLDLAAAEPIRLDRPVDTVVALNVLEHLHDDVGALRRLSDVLVPGGRVVIWVPGYPALYGDFDRKVGHVRRYTPRTLRRAFTAAGLDVETVRPVNLLGGIAWWLAVRLGGAGEPRARMVRAYDRLIVPTTGRIERVIRPPFGQTVFGVARTPS